MNKSHFSEIEGVAGRAWELFLLTRKKQTLVFLTRNWIVPSCMVQEKPGVFYQAIVMSWPYYCKLWWQSKIPHNIYPEALKFEAQGKPSTKIKTSRWQRRANDPSYCSKLLWGVKIVTGRLWLTCCYSCCCCFLCQAVLIVWLVIERVRSMFHAVPII